MVYLRCHMENKTHERPAFQHVDYWNDLHLAVWGQVIIAVLIVISLDRFAGLSIPKLIKTLTGEFKDLFSGKVSVGALNAGTLLVLAAVVFAALIVPSFSEVFMAVMKSAGSPETADYTPIYVSLGVIAAFGAVSVIAARA